MKDSGEIKQIILLTDGKSNIGISPVEAAEKANKLGMVVSTVAIIDNSDIYDKSIAEAEGIAKAGGGLCKYCALEDLSTTLRLVCKKTSQKTMEHIIKRQLKAILGIDINDIEPRYRYKIVDFIRKYGDNVNLKCAVIIDCSGSMKNKLSTARQSLLELMESLKLRQGSSSLAVIGCPGIKDEFCNVICNFTDNADMLKLKLESINARGGTPTGPAIKMACEIMLSYICEENSIKNKISSF